MTTAFSAGAEIDLPDVLLCQYADMDGEGQKLATVKDLRALTLQVPIVQMVEWNLTRTALEQASFLLPTSDVCDLAATCRGLHSFLWSSPEEKCYWNDCKSCVRGKYNRCAAWLHALTSLERAGEFVRLARLLHLMGSVVLSSESQIMSLSRVLQEEHRYVADELKRVAPVTDRSIITWRFDPDGIAALLQGGTIKEVVSKRVRFDFRYGISFTSALVISRASLLGPELSLHLSPLNMIGEYLSKIDIEVRCSILCPDAGSSSVALPTVSGGANFEIDNTGEWWCKHASPSRDISIVAPDWHSFGELVSVVCVTMPNLFWTARCAESPIGTTLRCDWA